MKKGIIQQFQDNLETAKFKIDDATYHPMDESRKNELNNIDCEYEPDAPFPPNMFDEVNEYTAGYVDLVANRMYRQYVKY